jgi:hypothetical protein
LTEVSEHTADRDDDDREARRERRIRLATIAAVVIVMNAPRPAMPFRAHVGPFWLGVMVGRSGGGKRPVQFMARPRLR